MKTRIYTVNENGMNQIREFLIAKHYAGELHNSEFFTPDMLRAWAADAEFQLAEGNPASIEIRSFDAVSGHTETLTISDEGLDSEEIDIEE